MKRITSFEPNTMYYCSVKRDYQLFFSLLAKIKCKIEYQSDLPLISQVIAI